MAALPTKPFFAGAVARENITLGTCGAHNTTVASLGEREKEREKVNINIRAELISSESTETQTPEKHRLGQ